MAEALSSAVPQAVENIPETEECALCLDDICDPISPFQCKHQYCKSCILAWRSTLHPMANSCPVCIAPTDPNFDRTPSGREMVAALALTLTGVGLGAFVFEAASATAVVDAAAVAGGTTTLTSIGAVSPALASFTFGVGTVVGGVAALTTATGLAIHRFFPGFVSSGLRLVFEKVDDSILTTAKCFIAAERGIGKVHFFPFRDIDSGRCAMKQGVRGDNGTQLLQTKAPWGNSRILYVVAAGGARAVEVEARGAVMPLNTIRHAAKAACSSQRTTFVVL